MSKILFKISILSVFFIINIFSTADWTITTSGTYILNDDISASTGDATNGTINIASSYVTLDLGGRFIAQAAGGTAGAIGIVVNSGVTDVVIKNGTIRSFLQSGVRINRNNSRISLQNLLIESCAVRGIEFQGASGSTILSSEIKNSKIYNCCSSASADTALQLLFTNGLVIENLILDSNNPGSTGTFNTVLIDSCSYCSFNNVYVVNVTGAASSSVLRGFSFISNSAVVQTCILDNCQFNNSTNSSSGIIHGFYLTDNGSANLVNYNVFNNCLVSTSIAGGNFYGFYCSGSNCQTNVFDKCIVTGNTSSTGNFGGFEIDSTSKQNVFSECIALGNTHSSASSTGTNLGGFKIEGNASANALLRCVAADNVSTNTVCAGIYIVAGTSNYIKECQATKNVGNSDTNSNGLRWDAGANNIFVKNIASRNGSTGSTTDIGGAFPFPANSQTSATSATMSTPGVPWSNLKIAS